MRIYADNAATTKMSRTAIDTMIPYMEEGYGNPSSLYVLGQQAKEALDEARATIASVINADPSEILFTSGGSEADNHPLRCRSGCQEGEEAYHLHEIRAPRGAAYLK